MLRANRLLPISLSRSRIKMKMIVMTVTWISMLLMRNRWWYL